MRCSEDITQCVPKPKSSPCDDGLVCNGNDLCDENGGCVLHGGNACPRSCTCNELFGQCDNCQDTCFLVV
jgi:hypothetical protein